MFRTVALPGGGPIVLTFAVSVATLAAQTTTQTRPNGAITGTVVDGSTGHGSARRRGADQRFDLQVE